MPDIANILRIGAFVSAAYTPSGRAGQIPAYALPPGWELVDVILGNDLATAAKFDHDITPIVVAYGFIARNETANEIVVAVRGTEGLWEWLLDGEFCTEKCPIGLATGNTEDGFTDVYKSLTVYSGGKLADEVVRQAKKNPGAKMIVTGHSLGSSLATLLAFDAAMSGATVSAITFASPFVGNPAFAAVYNTVVPDTTRVANAVDIVTKLPGVGYQHVGGLLAVDGFGKAKPFPSCQHHLSTYFHLLAEKAGIPGYAIDPACAGLI